MAAPECVSTALSESETKILYYVESLIQRNKVMIFSKSWCPYCTKAKELFSKHGVPWEAKELDLMENGAEIQQVLHIRYGQKSVPNIFIHQRHIGGFSNLHSLYQCGLFEAAIAGENIHDYTYDLFVIGGGSGGIAAAKDARKLGKKVGICDYVVPSPQGSTWGFGGTCVNVGCIPKKLMHRASLIHHDFMDAPFFGWKDSGKHPHDWGTLVENTTSYIKSLNFQYRKIFSQLEIPLHNALGEFVNKHTLKLTYKGGKEELVTARNIIIATGLRPLYPDIPGAKEYGITSDDLFMLPKNPGKILVVGASYIALECAGFLNAFGIKCSVMVRSILLRGFDQEIAEKIEENMTTLGVHFIKECVPTKITKAGHDTLKVEGMFQNDASSVYTGTFDTVLFATGREPHIEEIKPGNINLRMNPRNKKIIVDERDRTNIPNIFAIGDIADLGLELTPVAIEAAKRLVQRLYNGKHDLTDYCNVPTTVFTPLEYGSVGLSEEKALETYNAEVEVFHNLFTPLESVLSERHDSECFAKIICAKMQDKKLKVVGVHYLGPNAGEVIQGFALALKLGATKDQFDSLIGVHPTCAEVFTTMSITKSSGTKLELEGC